MPLILWRIGHYPSCPPPLLRARVKQLAFPYKKPTLTDDHRLRSNPWYDIVMKIFFKKFEPKRSGFYQMFREVVYLALPCSCETKQSRTSDRFAAYAGVNLYLPAV